MRRGRIRVCNHRGQGGFRSVISEEREDRFCNQRGEGGFRYVIREEREDSGLYSVRRGRIQVCNK